MNLPPREIVEFYNLRGGKERIFDDMNNGFGWDKIAQILHGREHCVPSSYSTYP